MGLMPYGELQWCLIGSKTLKWKDFISDNCQVNICVDPIMQRTYLAMDPDDV